MTAVPGAAQADAVGSDVRNQVDSVGGSGDGGIQALDEEPTGNVTGTVSTREGEVIADADVRLVNATSGTVERTTSSDSDGGYRFGSVETGEYRVEAEFGESEGSSANVTVEEGKTRNRDVEMRLLEAYFSVSVEDTESPVTEGEEVRIDATVTNAGEESGSQAVVAEVPGLGSDAEPVSLDGGSSETVSLRLPTELGDAGDYTAEVSTNDDTEEAGVFVEAIGSGIDVSISGTNSSVVEGEVLTVEARVSNPTEVSGSGTVTAEVAGSDLVSDEQRFRLNGGTEETKNLSIQTENGDAGEYTVAVSVSVGAHNDTDSTNVTVEENAEADGTANETEAGDGVPAEGITEGEGDDPETEDTNASVTEGADEGAEDTNASVTEGADSETETENEEGKETEADAESQGIGTSGDGEKPRENRQFSLRKVGVYLGMGAAALVGFAAFVAFSVRAGRRLKHRDREQGKKAPDKKVGREQQSIVLDEDSNNSVYVSWVNMIESAGVEDIRTKTPSEIAKETKEAGLNPEAVEELTDVFEEVRYRDSEPTAEQEERARRAFERIERSNGRR